MTYLARGIRLLNLSIFYNFLLELITLTLSTRWYQVPQVNEYAAYIQGVTGRTDQTSGGCSLR